MLYRIRNTKTGFYSKGGQIPIWSKAGKIWPTAGALTSHLSQFHEKTLEARAQDWEIQEFDFDTGQINKTWTVKDYLASRPSRKVKDPWEGIDKQQVAEFVLACRHLTNPKPDNPEWLKIIKMAQKIKV